MCEYYHILIFFQSNYVPFSLVCLPSQWALQGCIVEFIQKVGTVVLRYFWEGFKLSLISKSKKEIRNASHGYMFLAVWLMLLSRFILSYLLSNESELMCLYLKYRCLSQTIFSSLKVSIFLWRATNESSDISQWQTANNSLTTLPHSHQNGLFLKGSVRQNVTIDVEY